MSVLLGCTVATWKKRQWAAGEGWIHPIFWFYDGREAALLDQRETEPLPLFWQRERGHLQQGEWILSRAGELLEIIGEGQDHLLMPSDFLLQPEDLLVSRKGHLLLVPNLTGGAGEHSTEAEEVKEEDYPVQAVLALIVFCSQTATDPVWNRSAGRVLDRLSSREIYDRDSADQDVLHQLQRILREEYRTGERK